MGGGLISQCRLGPQVGQGRPCLHWTMNHHGISFNYSPYLVHMLDFPCMDLCCYVEAIYSQRYLDYRAQFQWLLVYKVNTKPQGCVPTPNCT